MLNFKDPHPGRDGVRPSGAGRCVRQQAFAHQDYSPEFHPNLSSVKRQVTFAVGNATHEVVQEMLEGVRRVEGEVLFRVADRIVPGHIDGIVRCSDGVERLLEIKTMSRYSYHKFLESGITDEGYLIQAHLYLHGLQQQGEDIQEVLFLAINKDSHEFGYWIDRYNPSLADRGLKNMELALTEDPRALPRLDLDAGGNPPWQCAYCGFWRQCWPEATPSAEKVALTLGGGHG